MMELTLTPAQVAFMLKYHFLIETDSSNSVEPYSSNWQKLYTSDEYKELFGDMLWDDALDRYEDMPEYDPTLRMLVKIRSLIEENDCTEWTFSDLQEQIHRYRLDNTLTIPRAMLLDIVDRQIQSIKDSV